MGKIDKSQKGYFADPRHFADIWNGLLFQGVEVIGWKELQEGNAVQTSSESDIERTSDMIMKKTMDGQTLAILILENQTNVDYSMPARVFMEEALAYDKQVREIKRHNQNLEEVTGKYGELGAFIYWFKKKDRLRPVVTLVLYWGNQEWDGAMSMKDLIDFKGVEYLRNLVPEYPVHVVDMSKVGNTEAFHTDVRSLVEYYQRRNDKDRFRDYYENCEEAYELDDDGIKVLSHLVKSKELELLKTRKNNSEEGKVKKMCRAITELIEDGREEGRSEGKLEGRILEYILII